MNAFRELSSGDHATEELAAELSGIYERAHRETLAFLRSRPTETVIVPAQEWMTATQLAEFWQLYNDKNEPTIAGILKWTKRPLDHFPLPHAYMGDLLRFNREDAQRSMTLKTFFGEEHLRDIKPMMIEQFKWERLATPTKHDTVDRPRPRTPASVNRDLACLSKILSMAYDNELIYSNPVRRVRMLKEGPSRERCITAEEEKRLFAQLTGRRDHIRSVVTIALNTGMRRGEILGLQ